MVLLYFLFAPIHCQNVLHLMKMKCMVLQLQITKADYSSCCQMVVQVVVLVVVVLAAAVAGGSSR